MRTNRFYFALIALLGAIALIASTVFAGKSYAQASPQTLATPRPPALWVLNGGNGSRYTPAIAVFQAPKLKRKTGQIAALGIRTSGAAVEALAFDSSQDLWLGLCGDFDLGYVVELTATGLRHLVAYGSAKFSVIIQDPLASSGHGAEYLGCPQALQFDPSGNLWVESPVTYDPFLYGTSLLEYTSDDLSSSGKPVPATVIEAPTSGGYSGPLDMTFDHAGNLWLVSGGILEYTAAQLAAGVHTDPNQTLIMGGDLSALEFVKSITFDANGNLWAAFETGGTGNAGGVEMFAAADLNGSGTVTPVPAITLNAALYGRHQDYSSFESPDGLAFDSQGDLWVANTLQPKAGLGSGSLVEFTPSELAASGSPVPVRAILANWFQTNLSSPDYMTFGPALP